MMKAARLLPLIGFALAACATSVPEEPAVQRLDAAPRPALNTVSVGGQTVRTLADAADAREIERRASRAAADGFEGDNKGNACPTAPVFRGVSGGSLSADGDRRNEFWTYSVCGETYEVPVVVTRQPGSGAVAFTVGSGREAR